MSEYLCPDDFAYYCEGKSGCVKNRAICESSNAVDPAEKKPGFKAMTDSDLPVEIISESVSIDGQFLFNHLTDIVPWKNLDNSNNDVIQFCSKVNDCNVWVKMVFKKSTSYDKAKNEKKFFTEKLTKFTPHIVQCAASKIIINRTGGIEVRGSREQQTLIASINEKVSKSEKSVCVFYMQPNKWVYMSTYLSDPKFTITEHTLVSILFQMFYTLACIETKQYKHGNLGYKNSIALDLNPKEKNITYYYNNDRFCVPINVKVIVLNWENAEKSTTFEGDITDFCKTFKALMETLNHPEATDINNFIEFCKDKTSAYEILNHVIFKRFKVKV